MEIDRIVPRVSRLARLHKSSQSLGLALLALAASPPTAASAHEIGTTRVALTLAADQTYTVTVTADASALLARLQVARHERRTDPQTAAAFQNAFDAVCAEVPRHLALSFDGAASVPTATCAVDAAAPTPDDPFNVLGVTVTLRGDAPEGARTFRWKYDLASASYAVLLQAADGRTAHTEWLEGGEETPPIALVPATDPSRAEVARTYLHLGFTHIVPKGLDHILFVLGLFLLSRRLRPLLLQVSAFTLAHSITLGLTLYGLIALSPAVVEPLIALSIVYVAVENLMTSELTPWRVVLVFAFGLLHGMGFAGVLRELALPRSEFLTGLVAFNVGVEAGQLMVILTAFLIVGAWIRRADVYRRVVVVPASAAIAAIGVAWTLQRLMP